jgi:hypothetical protein
MLYVKVFQRRTDGSTDFYRDWSAYEDGFGDRKEFWQRTKNDLQNITQKTKN